MFIFPKGDILNSYINNTKLMLFPLSDPSRSSLTNIKCFGIYYLFLAVCMKTSCVFVWR